LLSAVLVVWAVSGASAQKKGEFEKVWPSALVDEYFICDGVTSGMPTYLDLKAGGTGIVDESKCYWRVVNKSLVLQVEKNYAVRDYSYNYKLSGNELILDYGNGVKAVFVKGGKENIEKYKKNREEEVKKRIEEMSSYFTDPRDGRKYRTVNIGGKTWMAENMNYKTANTWCYNDDSSMCEKTGRLYERSATGSVCPEGWHMPNNAEWEDLIKAAGGDIAGITLKPFDWWNGTDEYGFSARAGGYRTCENDFFSGKCSKSIKFGGGGKWWSESYCLSGSCYASYFEIYRNSASLSRGESKYCEFCNRDAFSVRCVADE